MSIISAFVIPHPPIIIPEVGRGKEEEIAKTSIAINKVMQKIAEFEPDTVIVVTPHSMMYEDYFHISPGTIFEGNLGKFGADSVKYKGHYDAEFVNVLEQIAIQENISAGTMGERDATLDHGTLIPMYFLEKVGFDCPIVRISLSGFSPAEHYLFGQCVKKASDVLNRQVVIIASGDLSHKLKKEGPYGLAPEGIEFDLQVTTALAKGDFLSLLSFSPEFVQSAAECGLKSFQIMAGALDRKAITHDLLSYEGPFGVGYAVAAFIVKGDDLDRNFLEQFVKKQREKLDILKSEESEYVGLARKSLETYIRTGEYAKVPLGISSEIINNRAGVFVSLKKKGMLRGCIGTISPITDNVAEEIFRNAISAAVEDSRFEVVKEDELDQLVYSVDVLGETEKIASSEELDVKRYGVIVQSGRKRGLLLPNLDGINTVSEQVSIAKQKGGIGEHEKVNLFRFEVVRYR